MYALDPVANALTNPEAPGAVPLDPSAALKWLQSSSGHPLRAPIGVIGPREEDDDRNHVAEAVGRKLGEWGFTVLCGGRGGVMRAAAKGATGAGGLTIGLLPEADPDFAQSLHFRADRHRHRRSPQRDHRLCGGGADRRRR